MEYLFDRQLGWRNIPNYRGRTFGEKLTTNSLGLRDREHPYEKSDGELRLLILGDSYAWGYGVADDEIFPELLERKLPAPWTVINTSVSGWGTDQEFLYLKSEGFRYSPDLILLALFLGNDPRNNSAPQQYGLNKPVYLNTSLKLGNSPVPSPGERNLIMPARSYSQQLDITMAILKALASECEQRKTPLIVMKFGRFAYPGNKLFANFDKDFLSRFRKQLSQVPLFDWDQAYEARPSTDSIRLDNDSHWNALGHRITAEMLNDYLRREGFVQSAGENMFRQKREYVWQ